jgi:hypothetical protein
MKQVLLAIGVAALSSAGILAANDDVRVRLTGCVLDGKDGSFVLSDVQELSGGKMSPTSNLYWLSTTKGLKEQIGHRIEVTGTFSPSRDVGKTGTIKTKLDPATGHETIEIENGAKKAERRRHHWREDRGHEAVSSPPGAEPHEVRGDLRAVD